MKSKVSLLNLAVCNNNDPNNFISLRGQAIYFLDLNSASIAANDEEYFNTLSKGDLIYCDGYYVFSILRYFSKLNLLYFTGPFFFMNGIKNYPGVHCFLGITSLQHKEFMSVNSSTSTDSINFLYFDLPYVHNISDLNANQILEFMTLNFVDHCWVCIGAPKQEKLIDVLSSMSSLRINYYGIGGAFNIFLNNNIPFLFRKFKIIWLYRLIKEPKKQFKKLKYIILNLYSTVSFYRYRVLYKSNS